MAAPWICDRHCTEAGVAGQLNAGTLWTAAVTLLRLFLGAWMVNSGYSYWAQIYGLPPAFPALAYSREGQLAVSVGGRQANAS